MLDLGKMARETSYLLSGVCREGFEDNMELKELGRKVSIDGQELGWPYIELRGGWSWWTSLKKGMGGSHDVEGYLA